MITAAPATKCLNMILHKQSTPLVVVSLPHCRRSLGAASRSCARASRVRWMPETCSVSLATPGHIGAVQPVRNAPPPHWCRARNFDTALACLWVQRLLAACHTPAFRQGRRCSTRYATYTQKQGADVRANGAVQNYRMLAACSGTRLLRRTVPRPPAPPLRCVFSGTCIFSSSISTHVPCECCYFASTSNVVAAVPFGGHIAIRHMAPTIVHTRTTGPGSPTAKRAAPEMAHVPHT